MGKKKKKDLTDPETGKSITKKQAKEDEKFMKYAQKIAKQIKKEQKGSE